ncbi:hypothetical protein B0181_05765 [Moraxella caviae]|uniref:SH3b domain-containing protein n=1 Tax=Moraxella caviae TaxID=34060 RepID=A0A1T0A2L0_9GAMM|nr:SH3 domain-containing protein [Moraxella caviae]OOR89917.1 hypothetical protein B0181_05765 [Moraxella caviae]STZ14300.1 Uncharacterised protein [Moraxella caviae]VEW12248.1 Uncharacterised protein [Moraxella caviae]
MKFMTKLFAASTLGVMMFSSVAYAQYCEVADPTSTLLNVRQGVYGKVTDKLHDGHEVDIIRTSYDKKGKPWVKVSYWKGGDYREGWVYRNYLKCY